MWEYCESRAKLATRTLTPDSELALLRSHHWLFVRGRPPIAG